MSRDRVFSRPGGHSCRDTESPRLPSGLRAVGRSPQATLADHSRAAARRPKLSGLRTILVRSGVTHRDGSDDFEYTPNLVAAANRAIPFMRGTRFSPFRTDSRAGGACPAEDGANGRGRTDDLRFTKPEKAFRDDDANMRFNRMNTGQNSTRQKRPSCRKSARSRTSRVAPRCTENRTCNALLGKFAPGKTVCLRQQLGSQRIQQRETFTNATPDAPRFTQARFDRHRGSHSVADGSASAPGRANKASFFRRPTTAKPTGLPPFGRGVRSE